MPIAELSSVVGNLAFGNSIELHNHIWTTRRWKDECRPGTGKTHGFKLFHNHMTIELVLNFFEFEDARFQRLVSLFRRRVFEEVAASELPGLIFTFVWAMDLEADKKFIDNSCEIFREQGAGIYFVELEAELSERLKRNEAPSRLTEKPSKRDVNASRELLLEHDEKHQLNSRGDFFYTDNYLKIDNTHLSAHDAARKIVERFGFTQRLTTDA